MLLDREEKRGKRPAKKETVSSGRSGRSAAFLQGDQEKILAWQKRAILITVSLLSAVILSPKLTTSLHSYSPGDIARQNIKAVEDMLVEDTSSTLKKRSEAEALSLAVYDFDETSSAAVRSRISESFADMRGYLSEAEKKAAEKATKPLAKSEAATEAVVKTDTVGKKAVSAYIEESRQARLAAFSTKLGIEVKEADFRVVETYRFKHDVEEILKSVVVPIMAKGVVDSHELLSGEKEKGIVVRQIKSQAESRIDKVSSLLGITEARSSAQKQILSFRDELGKNGAAAISEWASALISPNLTFNKKETEERKVKAVEGVSPVFFQVKEGEMILREGERVKKEQVMILDALLAGSKNEISYIKFAGLALLVGLILFTVYHFSVQNIRKVSLDPGDMIFLGILFVMTLFFSRASIPLTEALSRAFTYLPVKSYQYLFTAAAGAMLVRIVLNSEVAALFSVATSLMVAAIMKDTLFFGIYTFVGCITGAHMVRYCNTRFSLIKAGLYVGVVNVCIVLIFGMAYGELVSEETLFSALTALAGGIISGVIVTGVIPVVEGLFGYTTNFKLLELASLDHPLLKELITQAPGTYHHSWIIGNLVEAAAESINANPIFAKVSALYHDIGKIKKPQYFFENQKGEKNPHDKLTPSLSGLIVIGHVKDGIELAREHKLGKRLTDIIPQHHGTRLMKFFYQKAKDKEDPDVHSVDEKDFRYPGPKPQTKEAGLVMLGDAVEAATRTIQDPTPARIQGTVQKIIGEIFADGQLEECELTLKDINRISKSFNRVLNGIFHARIDYPEAVVKGGKEKRDEGADGIKKETQGGKKEGDRREGRKNTGSFVLQ